MQGKKHIILKTRFLEKKKKRKLSIKNWSIKQEETWDKVTEHEKETLPEVGIELTPTSVVD